jgi:hypothetical protein
MPQTTEGELLPLASVHDLREAQREALLIGVDQAAIRFLLLESGGGQWQPVEPGSFRFEGQQDRVLVWNHPDPVRAAQAHRALASELVAIALDDTHAT